jgi:ectoine hydroxylase-related dioxygenase (phytanoyl-CoA dioxygenase family)
VGLSVVEQSAFAESIARDGWAVTSPVVPQLEIDRLVAEVMPLADNGRGGVRNLLDESPAVRTLATSVAVRSVAEAVLGSGCFAVRATLFDKTPGANWKVVWHQDVTIAVRQRERVHGFGPWTEKAGVTHVQPPAEVLEGMLAVRVHLDACGADNGPVRVISGSHRAGRLSAAAIDAWRTAAQAVEALADRGGIIAFRPLILHASSPATAPAPHRRVIHIDFAAIELPEPLDWHSRVA